MMLVIIVRLAIYQPMRVRRSQEGRGEHLGGIRPVLGFGRSG